MRELFVKGIKIKSSGFTIVELLIVIAIIGVLSGLVLVTYNGIADQARQTRIKSDLKQLSDSIVIAQHASNKKLIDITGNNATMYQCVIKPDGTDLAKLPKTDPCWANYLSALKKISDASRTQLNNLVDPWGRPYYIDENEGEPGYPACIKDAMGAYTYPFKNGYQHLPNTTVNVPNESAQCQ